METDLPSTRPYLIRALHEWCTDGGFTPYIVVAVDERVQVPREFVRDGQIVLNVSFDATSGLRLGNDVVEFKARFGGVPRDVVVPVDHVIAIYARENGQGMAFPAPQPAAADAPPQRLQVVASDEARESADGLTDAPAETAHDGGDGDGHPARGGKRPTLTRIK
ncbi:ClpXP protease specificity-enhancing factor [Tepidimonas fonticaldi]|uniref:ClpXP protease specificity-enhancing factor n=1 Tax=Tepidimonas fonticaldi TaxID=1101373 RepID=A0A1A6DZB5_9BURK|nr:ClpXP protease specificity-enhancing factor [Tepidimonas fonticaldi]OBS32115.1 ClpXP protease specificity-enhancing factor [Tepidimonas fonticaldi]